MVVFNETRNRPVATRANRAGSFWDRFLGLMGRRTLDVGEGLIIQPCNSVHSWFMRFAIDVFYVGPDGRVLRLVANLRPWHLGPIVRGAQFVVEVPAGTALATDSREGDTLVVA